MERESAEPTGPLSSFIHSLRIRKSKQEACSRKELVFGFSYLSPPSGRPSNGQTSCRNPNVLFAASGCTSRSLIYRNPTNPSHRVGRFGFFLDLQRAGRADMLYHPVVDVRHDICQLLLKGRLQAQQSSIKCYLIFSVFGHSSDSLRPVNLPHFK